MTTEKKETEKKGMQFHPTVKSDWEKLGGLHRLAARDCYAQFRALGRLLSQLEDDLGDLCTDVRRPELEPIREEMEAAQDEVTRVIASFQQRREWFAALSRDV